MKKLATIATILVTAGCASPAPLTYHEECATKGMSLSGVTGGRAYTSAYTSNGTYVGGTTESEAVACEIPKTEVETCEIKRRVQVAEPKLKYNNTVGAGKAIGGIGWLFIAPGLLTKMIWDSKKFKAVKESEKIEQETAAMCSGTKQNQEIKKQANY